MRGGHVGGPGRSLAEEDELWWGEYIPESAGSPPCWEAVGVGGG